MQTARCSLLVILLAAVSVQAKVIDFESLNAGPNGTSGLDVRNQFAADGIIFSNASALDYSQGIVIPNFAHSGTKAIELCRAAEFCTQPLELTFTTPQRHVKVWVGFSAPLASTQVVVMRAFDQSNNELSSIGAALVPAGDVIPISAPLEINLPPASASRIVRVTVGFIGAEASTPTMLNNGLAVDDVEYDTTGAPPGCPATQPPGIGMIAPFDGQIVVQNAFTVDANITTPDPFATIEVRATGQAGLTNNFGPIFVASGRVRFANITGLLFPGADTVTVEVKDCGGTNSRTVTVNYRTDITFTQIEVIDEDNQLVPGAEVYAGGVLLGHTDRHGLITAAPPLSDGTDLVARRFILESPTYRGNHGEGSTQDWKMRVYVTNLAVQDDGTLQRQGVKLEPNPLALQVIKVLRKNPLIGVHLVTSLEWDASAAEMQTVRQYLAGASHFLYNATDGQLLLEQVEILDNSSQWEDADIRVFAAQSFRSYVDDPLGGFFHDSFWENGSWIHVGIHDQGATYAHEFGHYSFAAGDEYSDDDPNVQCTAQLRLGTSPPGLNPFQSGMPQASCMMYDPDHAVKICSNQPGNRHVHGTNEGDSPCWDKFVGSFRDNDFLGLPNNNPRWTLQSPDTRGAIPGTINSANLPLPAWEPRVTFQNSTHPNLCAPIQFTAKNSDGTPAPLSDVWLHTTYGADIYQGKTKADSQLTVTGVHLGDTINDLTVLAEDCQQVALFAPADATSSRPHFLSADPGPGQQDPAGPRPAPRALLVPTAPFHLFATLTPNRSGTGKLLVWAESSDAKPMRLKESPRVRVKPIGHGRIEVRTCSMGFHRPGTSYAATLTQLPLDADLSIEVTATDRQGHTQTLFERFQMSRPNPRQDSAIFSLDGQLKVKVPAGALPKGARLAIGPMAAPPPALSAGEVLLSGTFHVATDSRSRLSQPLTLSFQLPRDGSQPGSAGYDPESFSVVEYDAATGTWAHRAGVFIPAPIDVISVKASTLGTFAVVARRKPI